MACSSLLVPTSDLEEEWRSESEEERPDLSGQILAIQFHHALQQQRQLILALWVGVVSQAVL